MKKILLVEDEAIILESVSELLELNGYTVMCSKNGLEALEVLKNYKPDLIVCDIKMPEMDGYSFVERIREMDQLSRIPFLFLSAKVEPEEVRKGMEMGADDYLTKPFKSEDLLKAIEARIQRFENLMEIGRKESYWTLEKQEDFNKLSKTEKKVLEQIKNGLSTKSIAEKFFVSVKTVDNHRNNIIKKLNLKGHNSLLKYIYSLSSEVSES